MKHVSVQLSRYFYIHMFICLLKKLRKFDYFSVFFCLLTVFSDFSILRSYLSHITSDNRGSTLSLSLLLSISTFFPPPFDFFFDFSTFSCNSFLTFPYSSASPSYPHTLPLEPYLSNYLPITSSPVCSFSSSISDVRIENRIGLSRNPCLIPFSV